MTPAERARAPPSAAGYPHGAGPRPARRLAADLEVLYDRMQTPEHRRALERALRATPEQMGRAAVAAARRDTAIREGAARDVPPGGRA